MLAFRSVEQSNHCAREEFLYELKAVLGRQDQDGDGYPRYSRFVRVSRMESRLKRVLHWLGFTQPNGSVGAATPFARTPFRARNSMARKGQQANWARCAAEVECLGASAGPEGYCLAHLASHLDDADFAARLGHLVQEETLDARGVRFTEDLLERLLDACPRNEAQAPVFEGVVRFDQVTFEDRANFEGTIFRESAIFEGATFKAMVRGFATTMVEGAYETTTVI